MSSVQCGGQKAGTRSSLMVRNTEESGASLSLVRQRVSRLIRERDLAISLSSVKRKERNNGIIVDECYKKY